MQSTIESVLTNMDLNDESLDNVFSRVCDAFLEFDFLGVPSKVLKLRDAGNIEFILLGTKEFGEAFIRSVTDKSFIKFVVDDFRAEKNELFLGIEIITTKKFIEIIKKNPRIVAFNTCRYDYSRRFFEKICRDYDVPCINFEQAVRLLQLNDFVDYRQSDWGKFIAENKSQYISLEEKLSDHYSKQTLYSVLLFHLTCNPEWYLDISRPYHTLYFRSGLFKLCSNEKLVDCGASIGESTAALIGNTRGSFDRSWMIEPDRYNVETLEKFVKSHEASSYANKISIHPLAVGEVPMEVQFNHTGWHGGSIVYGDGGNGIVNVDTVDNIIDDKPSIIKMDIEGSEISAFKRM